MFFNIQLNMYFLFILVGNLAWDNLYIRPHHNFLFGCNIQSLSNMEQGICNQQMSDRNHIHLKNRTKLITSPSRAIYSIFYFADQTLSLYLNNVQGISISPLASSKYYHSLKERNGEMGSPIAAMQYLVNNITNWMAKWQKCPRKIIIGCVLIFIPNGPHQFTNSKIGMRSAAVIVFECAKEERT